MNALITLMLISCIQLSSPQCSKYFPKILGSSDGGTNINDLDANQTTIYSCGMTLSDTLSGYPSSNPYVAAFDIAST